MVFGWVLAIMGQFPILVLHQPLHFSHRYLCLRFMGLLHSHAPRPLHLRFRTLQIFYVPGNRSRWRRVTRASTATHAVALHAPVAHVAMTHIMATFNLLHLSQPSPPYWGISTAVTTARQGWGGDERCFFNFFFWGEE